jgi:hypothetical protein
MALKNPANGTCMTKESGNKFGEPWIYWTAASDRPGTENAVGSVTSRRDSGALCERYPTFPVGLEKAGVCLRRQ